MEQSIQEKSIEPRFFKLKENNLRKQPSQILDYTSILEAEEVISSDAENIKEVIYFLEDPTIPHLIENFDEVFLVKEGNIEETTDIINIKGNETSSEEFIVDYSNF